MVVKGPATRLSRMSLRPPIGPLGLGALVVAALTVRVGIYLTLQWAGYFYGKPWDTFTRANLGWQWVQRPYFAAGDVYWPPLQFWLVGVGFFLSRPLTGNESNLLVPVAVNNLLFAGSLWVTCLAAGRLAGRLGFEPLLGATVAAVLAVSFGPDIMAGVFGPSRADLYPADVAELLPAPGTAAFPKPARRAGAGWDAGGRSPLPWVVSSRLPCWLRARPLVARRGIQGATSESGRFSIMRAFPRFVAGGELATLGGTSAFSTVGRCLSGPLRWEFGSCGQAASAGQWPCSRSGYPRSGWFGRGRRGCRQVFGGCTLPSTWLLAYGHTLADHGPRIVESGAGAPLPGDIRLGPNPLSRRVDFGAFDGTRDWSADAGFNFAARPGGEWFTSGLPVREFLRPGRG